LTAADAINLQPPTRPEKAAKTPVEKGDGKSFADVLEDGHADPHDKDIGEAAHATKDKKPSSDAATDDTTNVVTAAPAPLTQPTAGSQNAILASLPVEAPASDAGEANAEPVAPTAATSAPKASTPLPAIDVQPTAPEAKSPAAKPDDAKTASLTNSETSSHTPNIAQPSSELASDTSATPGNGAVLTPEASKQAGPTQPAASTHATASAQAAAPTADGATAATANTIRPKPADTLAATKPSGSKPQTIKAAVTSENLSASVEDAPGSAPGAKRAASSLQTSEQSTQKSVSTKTTSGNSAQKTSSTLAATSQSPADTSPSARIETQAGATATSSAETFTASRTTGSETARAAHSANPTLQSAPPATIQVYSRIIDNFAGRTQRFEVRLDPAELGRVDVRIEVGADKKVHAVLAAHDSAALTDLMRGQRSLENALRQSGIDVADGGVKFELSNDAGRGFSGSANRDETASQRSGFTNVWRGFSTVDVPVEAGVATAARAWRSSRLDVVA
jgi:hypothetical protein